MSSTAFRYPGELLGNKDAFSLKNAVDNTFTQAAEDFQKLAARTTAFANNVESPFSKTTYIGLVLVVLIAHVFGVDGFLKSLTEPSIIKKEKTEVIVEFVKPVVEPPPVIEPPKPLPPEPKVKHEIPKPVPKPAVLKTAPAEDNIAPSDITVKENTEAVRTSEPVVAEPSPPEPPPPAPVKEEPITEATGYAGYLNNPPPDFPAFAQRQGWEGKVILRVRVLASGHPSDIQIKKSSGHKILDESALEAVHGWTFAPAKKGDRAIDGWATVPIEFKQP